MTNKPLPMLNWEDLEKIKVDFQLHKDLENDDYVLRNIWCRLSGMLTLRYKGINYLVFVKNRIKYAKEDAIIDGGTRKEKTHVIYGTIDRLTDAIDATKFINAYKIIKSEKLIIHDNKEYKISDYGKEWIIVAEPDLQKAFRRRYDEINNLDEIEMQHKIVAPKVVNEDKQILNESNIKSMEYDWIGMQKMTQPTGETFYLKQPEKKRELMTLTYAKRTTNTTNTTNKSNNGELKMTNRKLVDIQLIDNDPGLDVSLSVVAIFKDVVTENDQQTTILELVMKEDIANKLTKHNEKRTAEVNKEVLLRTGNKVNLLPIKLKDLTWVVKD